MKTKQDSIAPMNDVNAITEPMIVEGCGKAEQTNHAD
jgi:hypothetical protein